ncbi:uncharacterized protein LOC131850652 [Achroia grisella]|uniref:uncharacterized protein LOC131850652 n=1 Tax=Achroia grisella TaxID=688607 RepID=UPI0027D2DE48|nr:uncharacterized protein LOC131850652 [Achroia grisella]
MDDERFELKPYLTVSDLRNSIDSSVETTSNSPAPETKCSTFDEGSCGEPLLSQHLVIDFSPVKELDNDVVQKKCCAFWKFIQSHPELQNLIEPPNTNVYPDISVSNDITYQDERTGTIKEPEVKEMTAVSMLEFVREGLIDHRTFEAKLPRFFCSLGSREYPDNVSSNNPRDATNKHKMKTSCNCTGVCKNCKKRPYKATANSQTELQVLCEKMRVWDQEHPKSLEPPGHPPSLNHCIMQNQILL